MSYTELLSPVGDFLCLKAAVAAGADAVYLGGSKLNAREGAKNFDNDELKEAINYCHLRGVKVYLTLNTVITDREIKELEDYIRYINDINIDGVIIQSLGLLKVIKAIAPQLEVHSSTQMTVHNLEGVKLMSELGFSRAVLAREVSAKDIKYICENSPIEIEAFIHGALCMCYSGQCYFSSIIGQRSGNRGRCAQPCRQEYKNGYELSLKDLATASMFDEFLKLGVTSFKIEGRLKAPEYVYGVTKIYRTLIDEKRKATKEEMKTLEALFSRQGFTDGYLKGEISKGMFGVRTNEDKEKTRTLDTPEIIEKQNLVDISLKITKDITEISITDSKITHLAQDNIAEPAQTKSTTREDIEKQLVKTGGTSLKVNKCDVFVEDGLFIPLSKVKDLRRKAVERFEDKLLNNKKKPTFDNNIQIENIEADSLKYNFHFTYAKQLDDAKEILSIAENIWLPLTELEKTKNNNIGIELPRIIFDSQKEEVCSYLETAKQKGIKKVLCSTVDQIITAKKLGFICYGNFSLNAFNSYDLAVLSELGINDIILSPECSLPRIRDMRKPLNVSVIGYGKLPLMVTENCIIKNSKKCINYNGHYVLEDKTGKKFDVICHYPHRNIILNANPIYLGDKMSELKGLVSGIDFIFTTEKGEEIKNIVNMYKNNQKNDTEFTRGLLFKNVL